MKPLIVTLLLLAATGCAGDGAPNAGADEERGAAACADIVEVDGRTWTSIPLSEPLRRDLVGAPVPASTQPCVDVEDSDGSITSADSLSVEEVVLRRIRGIPPRMALIRSDSPGPRRSVYVPSRPDGEVDDLPRVVRRLVRRG